MSLVLDPILNDMEVSLLKWINAFGFCQKRQVSQAFGISEQAAIIRLNQLEKKGCLQKELITHGDKGTFHLTTKGVRLSGDSLPALKKISLAKHQHDLLVLEVVTALTKDKHLRYMTERMLRRVKKPIPKFGQVNHISDAMIYDGDKTIAIEVELSSKIRARRESILQYYAKEFEIDELWYICKDHLIKKEIEVLLENRSFVRCFLLDEVLACG